jgi:hypothetical protein
VRETWQPIRDRSPEQQEKIKAWFDKNDTSNFMNEVDEWAPMPEGQVRAMYAADFGDWAFDVDSDLKPWKPSIFMPRWASRITLEILNVRVERLNEIAEEDAKAEGIRDIDGNDPTFPPDLKLCGTCGGTFLYEHHSELGATERECGNCDTYAKRFRILWEQINGKKHPWSNPWVWVITFKRI